MYDERRELVASYHASAVTLAALVRGLDDTDAAIRRDPGEWSISEVISHLLDAEQRTYERIIRIRDEDLPSLPLFPDDDYRGRSLRSSLASFLALRHEHARVLEDLAPSGWLRTGMHQAEGKLSIVEIARHTIAHDVEHLAQISRAIATPIA